MPKNICDVRTMASAPFPQNPGEKPMYCKDKIYTGAEEFSFEEIHAFRWTKMQEKLKREEEERKALEGMGQCITAVLSHLIECLS